METIISDFSSLEGSRRYCSQETETAIRKVVVSKPMHAVHLLGSGDFHYLSLFYLERIEEPFALVLIDNHPDDQPDAFGSGMLSCGSWVLRARELPFMQADIWIRRSKDATELPDGLPLYLSIDLDVLSAEYAQTNWDQGDMSISELTELLERLCRGRKIIGADICGALYGSPEEPLAPNGACLERILGVLGRLEVR